MTPIMLTDEIFLDYLKCRYKAFKKIKGAEEIKSEYDLLQLELEKIYKEKVINHYFSNQNTSKLQSTPFNVDNLKEGFYFLTDCIISLNGIETTIPVIEKNQGKSKLGSFYYIPILFNKNNKLSMTDKILLVFNSYVLGTVQGKIPEFGKIVYGEKFKESKIKITTYLPHVQKSIQELITFLEANNEPQFVIKDCCRVCNFCTSNALEKDSLSLLKGMPTKEIIKYNNNGIFTVNQLSYTFRTQKRSKRLPPRRINSFSLKALAIREKKVFVYGIPSLETSKNQIYLDIEGNENNTFRYLIGVVVITPKGQENYSFWADNKDEEETILNHFLRICNKYKDFTVYHYGSYESKFLKYAKKKYLKSAKAIDLILNSCVNILSIIYANIYFPTYSNGLKDIANYLNFKWSEENASGEQSIVWREKWETSHDDKFKQKLLQYNLEDCLALMKTKEYVGVLITEHAKKERSSSSQIAFADDEKYGSYYKWGHINFFYQEFDSINKAAYFDYQREKVYVRTSKKLKKVIQSQVTKRQFPVDKTIELTVLRCPKCKSYGLIKHLNKYKEKSVLDLKFSKFGVKKWIIRYSVYKYSCPKSNIYCVYHLRGFYPRKYDQLQRYGYAIKAWCVYEYVINKNSLEGIQHYINDLFGFHARYSEVARIKTQLANYYKPTYQQIIKRMIKSHVIYIDETKINLKDKSVYIWVLTNSEEVIFIFKESREGTFLKKLLKDFKGVLVSDFYSAYDALECEQQKCLIHLIRDFNGDLYENPYDEELKTIARAFSILLRNIVETIDKYGLKKRHLHRHKKDVHKFFKEIVNNKFHSEKAIYYQARFNKNKNKLFTFLDYDGITWNNNNAENAIKHIAKWRRIVSGHISESSVDEYCIFMSLYLTCKHRGVNFLRFLLSGKKDIENYKEK